MNPFELKPSEIDEDSDHPLDRWTIHGVKQAWHLMTSLGS